MVCCSLETETVLHCLCWRLTHFQGVLLPLRKKIHLQFIWEQGQNPPPFPGGTADLSIPVLGEQHCIWN